MKRFVDSDDPSCPVIGLEDEYLPGFTDGTHIHDRAQLLYASSGVMSVVVDSASFVIPPQRALWIPAGHAHEVGCRGHVSLRTLYFDRSVHDLGDGHCRVIEVSDFLKALILEVAHFGSVYDMDAREGRIIRLLLEEIRAMPNAPYHAPMPRDVRLLRVCRAILDDPSDQRDLDDVTAREVVPLTRGRVHVREEGEALAPNFFSLTKLRQREQTIGSRLFAAQYQQDPVPAKGDIVKAEWLLEYAQAPDGAAGGIIVQSWDTASKDDERNDYSVCITAVVNGRKVYILDVWRRRVQFSDLWKATIELARLHNCQSLLIEDTVNGTALIQRLRNDQPQGVASPIARRPKIDKRARLEAASSMIEAGDLLLPKDAGWLATFKAELLGFPSTRHDDQIDALSQLMNWVDERQRYVEPDNAGPILVDLDGPEDNGWYDPEFDPWCFVGQ